MRSDEEIRKSIFDDIVEILKHTIPKDSNVDPEAIASAVSTYLQNNPIEAGVPSENPVFTGSFSQNRKEGSTVGKYSYTEGYNGIASGNYSHAEGFNAIASGSFSHSEGYQTTASGDTSHAEGSLTTAAASYSHAEGYSTDANGSCSHSEGSDTTAGGMYSHAEGRNTSSSGDTSHAEGYGTSSGGMYSHAEGCNTSADGNMSFAGGNRTKTTAAAQFAVGYGNDPQADSIFEVGNGLDADGNPNNAKYTEPATRQNAFRVTQGGVAIAQTGLGIGNTSITEDQLIWLRALKNRTIVNVLDYGIVGDGKTDNYEAIQNLIDNVNEGSTIYFPKGVYCISKGLVTSNKNVNIVGERKGRYISKADTPGAKFGSIIKYIGTENATLITQGSGDWYLTISNITLYSDSCTFTDNGLNDETIPYLQYQLNTRDTVVNGIECLHGVQLRNICITGMSGYGVKTHQAQNIIDCNFYYCKTCIQMETNDLMLRNCYLTASGTAIYCKESRNLIVSDCYMDLLSEYGIYCESYLSGNITDCYIDHTNYAAVCAKGAFNNLNLDIYCGRNAMYYAGAADTDIKNSTATTELDNMAYGAAICTNLMFETNVKIHAIKRVVDDAGTSSKNTPVFTLYIQQLRSGYIEGPQITKYIRQTSNTARPVVVNANGVISTIYKSNEYTKPGVIKKTYSPQSTHMASQIGDQWIYGSSIYIATTITDTETTWIKLTTE